jgi:hypothetical protein
LRSLFHHLPSDSNSSIGEPSSPSPIGLLTLPFESLPFPLLSDAKSSVLESSPSRIGL